MWLLNRRKRGGTAQCFLILVKKHDDNTNILNSIMRKRCNFALSNKDNTNSMNEKYQFLTHAPVHRVIATMAFPTIISMLLTSVYNLVDTFFVGQIDTQSTAAVGIVFSVMFFIQAFSFFFGNGSGNYISRQLGAQKVEDAETMASTGLFYTLVFSVGIMLAGLLFLEPISILLGSTPTILPYTCQYLGISLLGTPFIMGTFCINN